MKNIFIFALLTILSSHLYGQNLVPNPSFETVINCPPNTGNACTTPPYFDPIVYSTSYWHNVGCGSADYFNVCNNSLNGHAGIPSNTFGFQYARTGNAYVGEAMSFNGYNEYFGCFLIDTLQHNKQYCVEFYVVRTHQCGTCTDSSDAIGALFTVGEPDTAGSMLNYGQQTLQYTAQINNPDGVYLMDTLNWMKISGTFTANGGENFITIGNFKSTAPSHGLGYYYFDDILVIDCDSLTGVNENFNYSTFKIYPNPFNTQLNIHSFKNDISEVTLFDITSRKLLQKKFTNSISLNTEQLEKGVYLYEVRNKDGSCKKGKVMKD